MFSLSSSDGSTLTAGDAGIVLSRFLPSDTGGFLVVDVVGLVVVRADATAEVRDAGVDGGFAGFSGVAAVPRMDGFFSAVLEGCIVDRRSEVEGVDL